MFCANCGCQNEDNIKFCAGCGMPVGNNNVQMMNPMNGYAGMAKPVNKKLIGIIIGVVVAIIAVVLIIVLTAGKGSKKETPEDLFKKSAKAWAELDAHMIAECLPPKWNELVGYESMIAENVEKMKIWGTQVEKSYDDLEEASSYDEDMVKNSLCRVGYEYDDIEEVYCVYQTTTYIESGESNTSTALMYVVKIDGHYYLYSLY